VGVDRQAVEQDCRGRRGAREPESRACGLPLVSDRDPEQSCGLGSTRQAVQLCCSAETSEVSHTQEVGRTPRRAVNAATSALATVVRDALGTFPTPAPPTSSNARRRSSPSSRCARRLRSDGLICTRRRGASARDRGAAGAARRWSRMHRGCWGKIYSWEINLRRIFSTASRYVLQRSAELLNWLHRYNWHRPHGS
jgi:hypothetical protein